MILPTSPWFYSEYQLNDFVRIEIGKHQDELAELYKSDMVMFEKKIRGIVIGTWQKKGAYGRETRAHMDSIINGVIDFAKIQFSILCEE